MTSLFPVLRASLLVAALATGPTLADADTPAHERLSAIAHGIPGRAARAPGAGIVQARSAVLADIKLFDGGRALAVVAVAAPASRVCLIACHAALKLSDDFKAEFDFGPNGQENGAAQTVDFSRQEPLGTWIGFGVERRTH